MTLQLWGAFAVTWLVVSAVPGPNAAFVVGVGLGVPKPRAFLAPLGIGLAACAHVMAASFGLATLLLAFPVAFEVIKWAGVAYLAWMGIRQIISSGKDEDADSYRSIPGGRLLMRGFAISLSNPKAILSYAAIFPNFISPASSPIPQLAVLGATASVIATLVYCGYVAAIGLLSAQALGKKNGKVVARIGGAAYLLAAGALAVVGR